MSSRSASAPWANCGTSSPQASTAPPIPSSGTGCARASELHLVLLTVRQPGDVRPMEDDDGERATHREGENRPGGAEEKSEERQAGRSGDRRDRGVPRDQEDGDPDPRRREGGEGSDGEADTSGRGDDLPPAREAHEQRSPVTDHGGATG